MTERELPRSEQTLSSDEAALSATVRPLGPSRLNSIKRGAMLAVAQKKFYVAY